MEFGDISVEKVADGRDLNSVEIGGNKLKWPFRVKEEGGLYICSTESIGN